MTTPTNTPSDKDSKPKRVKVAVSCPHAKNIADCEPCYKDFTKPYPTPSNKDDVILVMKPDKHSCMCELCADYQIEKFAELIDCGCYCHSHGYIGHDGLCCSLPNVLPKNHTEVAK